MKSYKRGVNESLGADRTGEPVHCSRSFQSRVRSLYYLCHYHTFMKCVRVHEFLDMVKFQSVYRHLVQNFPLHYCHYFISTFGGLVTNNVHCSYNSSPYKPYLEDQLHSLLHSFPYKLIIYKCSWITLLTIFFSKPVIYMKICNFVKFIWIFN